MIEYVEIRSADTREIIGIVDTAKSVIWHELYYGVGDFEVYAPCTPENVAFLVEGNYVTRYDAKNVGIIDDVNIIYNLQDGRMIVAVGKFAKSILDRRLIYKMTGRSVSSTIIRGNVEDAARSLVSQNAINCTFDAGRNIPELMLGPDAGIAQTIVDESGAAARKQVTHDNLLTYTDSLLQEFGMGAYCGLSDSLKLAYTVFAGVDRSINNTAGNAPVIFSQDFDNLISSDYRYNTADVKNVALVGGSGEGTKRFHTLVNNGAASGLARREIFVDAASHSQTYMDDDGVEQTIADDEYDVQLKALGRQDLAQHKIVETFNSEIDLTNGSFVYGRDFFLGDVVTVQDVEIGLYINPRILEVTEVQDENGYQISAVYGI